MSRLGQDNLRSPNAIPPRTSSTGISHSHTRSSKPVLRPLPESDWISQGRKMPEPVNGTTPHSTDPVQAAIECTRRGARAWSDEKEKILQGPYDYMFSHPGKDIRSQLIAGFNSWLKVPEDSLAIITKVVGMLHTASLLVDDVEDGSVLRRGIPVAHSIFGTAQAINSANYVYFCALHEIQALNNPIAIQIFTEELINLHRGQGMDLYWRDALTCPTEEDYLEMVGNKTGGLFRLAIKLMQAQSQSDKNCIPLADLIGVIFQVQDDYQNLQSTVYTENKGLCEDLTEGKFSFPIIHSIRAAPDNLQLLNILRQKTTDDGVKCYAVAYMESTGSFEYTRQFVRSLTEKAYTYVDELDAGEGGGEGIRVILGKLGRL